MQPSNFRSIFRTIRGLMALSILASVLPVRASVWAECSISRHNYATLHSPSIFIKIIWCLTQLLVLIRSGLNWRVAWHWVLNKITNSVHSTHFHGYEHGQLPDSISLPVALHCLELTCYWDVSAFAPFSLSPIGPCNFRACSTFSCTFVVTAIHQNYRDSFRWY